MLKGLQLSLLVGPMVPLPAPQPVVEALKSVQVTTSAGQRSGFQLTFEVGKSTLLNNVLLPAGYFDPMIRVILMVIVKGLPSVLIDGVITQQQVSPSNDPGQSTLTITGDDLGAVMDLIDLSGLPYPAMPLEARVALILSKYAVYGMIPLVIPSVVAGIPNPLENIPSQRGTDFAYITSLADQVGYVFYIESGPAPGVNIAYWGPEIKIGLPQPALNVNMDAHTNVESLSFSFNGLSKKQFVVLIQIPETRTPLPIPVPDVSLLNPPLGVKMPVPLGLSYLREHAKLKPWQAAAVGLARASQASDVITASGQLDVLRYGRPLKARHLVGVRGAGITYDGFYFVKSVTHNIERGKYTQSFNLSRNAHISITPVVLP